MAESEGVLLARYAEGRDPEAFRALVERHQGMVFAACHRVLGNAADAEDAAQNCFLQLARKAGQLRPPIAGWLHRVAMHAAIDLLRRNQSRREREKAVAKHRGGVSEPGWEQVKRAVDAGIASLPDDLREPVILHYLEGRTQEDIATELGLTQSAVWKRLQRGVEALQRHLRRNGLLLSVAGLAALLSANAVEAAPAMLTAALGKMALAGAAAGAATGAAAAKGATIGGIALMKAGIILTVATALAVGGIVAHKVLSRDKLSPSPARGQPPPAAGAANAETKEWPAKSLSLPDVLDMVAAYCGRIADVRFTATVETTTTVDPEKNRRSASMGVVWDQTERWLITQQFQGANGQERSRSTSAWDGETGTHLAEPNADRVLGIVTPKADAVLNSAYCPLGMCTRFLGANTRQKLRNLESELTAVKEDTGDVLYAVKFVSERATESQGESATTVWFSSRRSFAPVRRQLTARGKPLVDVVADLEELKPGIWGPVQINCHALAQDDFEGDYKSGAMTVVKVDRTSYEVNAGVKKEDFDIHFPKGGSRR